MWTLRWSEATATVVPNLNYLNRGDSETESFLLIIGLQSLFSSTTIVIRLTSWFGWSEVKIWGQSAFVAEQIRDCLLLGANGWFWPYHISTVRRWRGKSNHWRCRVWKWQNWVGKGLRFFVEKGRTNDYQWNDEIKWTLRSRTQITGVRGLSPHHTNLSSPQLAARRVVEIWQKNPVALVISNGRHTYLWPGILSCLQNNLFYKIGKGK